MDTVEDIQELCVKNLIKHFVMFDDLYPSKRQVQVSNYPLSTCSIACAYMHTSVVMDNGRQNFY